MSTAAPASSWSRSTRATSARSRSITCWATRPRRAASSAGRHTVAFADLVAEMVTADLDQIAREHQANGQLAVDAAE